MSYTVINVIPSVPVCSEWHQSNEITRVMIKTGKHGKKKILLFISQMK